MASQLNRTKVQAIRDPPSRHDNGCENRVEIDGIQVRSSDLPAGNVVGSWFKQSSLVTRQRSHEPGKTRFSNPKGELSTFGLRFNVGRRFPDRPDWRAAPS